MTRRARVAVVAGLAVLVAARRRRTTARERVDLYYDDGSVVTLDAGTPDADRLLHLAREALARSAA